MRIYLNTEAMKCKNDIINKVEEFASFDPQFSGLEYEILEDDFTYIDKDSTSISEIDLSGLLSEIFKITNK